jgi:hypothetical protein
MRTDYHCPCGFRTEYLSIFILHTLMCEVWAFRTDPKTIARILGQ